VRLDFSINFLMQLRAGEGIHDATKD